MSKTPREAPVFSTSKGVAVAGKGGRAGKGAEDAAYTPSRGPLKVRLETNGRGGKAVTVLFNLPFPSEDAARAVMQALQSSFGCGATLKNGTIELRGDMRDRIDAYFAKEGVKVVRAGG